MVLCNFWSLDVRPFARPRYAHIFYVSFTILETPELKPYDKYGWSALWMYRGFWAD